MTRRLLRRAAPIVIVAAAVVAGAVVVYRDRQDLADTVQRLGIGAVLLSLVCGLAGVFVQVLMWRAILGGLGAGTDFRGACRVFFVSQLGKYLPGSVWPVVAQMEFGRRRGIPRRTMLSANVLTIAISLAVGLVVAAVLLPLSTPAALADYWWALLLLPPLLACLHPRVVPALVDLALRVLRREPMGQRLPVRTLVPAVLWSLVSWGFLGLHVFVVAVAFGAGAADLAAAIGAMAFAVAAGIMFLPAPAGAGVRDAVLVLTLTPAVGATDALATALASRVLLVLVDLILAGASAPLRSGSYGRVPPDRSPQVDA